MARDYMDLRKEVCEYAKKMAGLGWVTGSSGNVSVRVPDEDDRYVITPTSVKYDELTPENVVPCDGEGEEIVEEIENAASFELPLHVAIYRARPDVHAVIHSHALYSTVLSVLRLSLPPIAEELVPYLGGEILVAEYGQSGTEELAERAVDALGDKAACFIANHGNVCVGKNLAKAFAAGELLERSAHIYVESLKLQGLKLGSVTQLPDEVVESEVDMYQALKDF